MAQYKTRDPQNPYRTGVLVGNYVEDKFGAGFVTQEVSKSYEMLLASLKCFVKSLISLCFECVTNPLL